MSMTSRERVQVACRRGQPDRIPRDMWMESGVFQSLLERIPGRDLLEYFRVDVRPVIAGPTGRTTDFSRYFDREVEWDEWGRGRVWDDERHYAEYLYPLQHARSLAEIAEYPWPDLDEDYRYQEAASQVRSWHEAGYAVVADAVETVFEVAWQLRSMDALFEDIKFRPDWAAALLDRIAERRAFTAARFAEAGVDVVQLGDDVAMQTGLMMNRELWREWLAPRLRRVIQAAKEANPEVLIWYHSDGNITDLIPDLIEVGVEILNPVQPECVNQTFVRREYGEHLAFWGGLGVQSVLPFGTPDEVRKHVKEVIEALGIDGGLVVGPSHVLERDTPFENILAMKQAIDEYGEY
jgi:uroporphyrinogen decarboxylase